MTPERKDQIRAMAETLQWARDQDAADAMIELLAAVDDVAGRNAWKEQVERDAYLAEMDRSKRAEDERDAAVAALSELKAAVQAHRDAVGDAKRSSNSLGSWGANAAVVVAAYDRVTAALTAPAPTVTPRLRDADRMLDKLRAAVGLWQERAEQIRDTSPSEVAQEQAIGWLNAIDAVLSTLRDP
jgi:hypothetical protein